MADGLYLRKRIPNAKNTMLGVTEHIANALKKSVRNAIFHGTILPMRCPLDINNLSNPSIVFHSNNPKFETRHSLVIQATIMHTITKQFEHSWPPRLPLYYGKEAPTFASLICTGFPATLRSYDIAYHLMY